VWGIGAEGGLASKSQTVSRVVFAVPLRLPDGDQSKQVAAEEAEAARKEKLRQASEARRTGGGPEGWMAR